MCMGSTGKALALDVRLPYFRWQKAIINNSEIGDSTLQSRLVYVPQISCAGNLVPREPY